MTDQPSPNGPQEYVMDLVTQEERSAEEVPTSRPYDALGETDSLGANQLAENTGIEVDRVDAALDRLQRDGRVHLTRLSDGTVVASKRETRG